MGVIFLLGAPDEKSIPIAVRCIIHPVGNMNACTTGGGLRQADAVTFLWLTVYSDKKIGETEPPHQSYCLLQVLYKFNKT